mmetsp:Transcript_68448/g.196362  ORF Transcript_68448/g.196362 Transcript_68448/m.196362 type:complete len:321 (-) Transcript_68448:533-1495(-)
MSSKKAAEHVTPVSICTSLSSLSIPGGEFSDVGESSVTVPVPVLGPPCAPSVASTSPTPSPSSTADEASWSNIWRCLDLSSATTAPIPDTCSSDDNHAACKTSRKSCGAPVCEYRCKSFLKATEVSACLGKPRRTASAVLCSTCPLPWSSRRATATACTSVLNNARARAKSRSEPCQWNCRSAFSFAKKACNSLPKLRSFERPNILDIASRWNARHSGEKGTNFLAKACPIEAQNASTVHLSANRALARNSSQTTSATEPATASKPEPKNSRMRRRSSCVAAASAPLCSPASISCRTIPEKAKRPFSVHHICMGCSKLGS